MLKSITAQELKNLLDVQGIALIDVREPTEYQAEHIQASKLVPLATISLDCLLPGTNVIYCRSGKRSEAACKYLLTQNPSLDLYNLEGGILAWKAAGGLVITR